MKTPRAAGLFFCEKLNVDPVRVQMKLTGLFRNLRFSTFPVAAPRFTVYAALYGGEGEGTIELKCVRLATEEDIYGYQRWLRFPDAGFQVHLEIKITNCVFPVPGRYLFTLSFDAQLVTAFHLDVIRKMT